MELNRVNSIENKITIKNVIISVADKSGLEEFVQALLVLNPGIQLFSTGGTFQYLKEILGEKASNNLISIADYTGQAEMQGGLVKTLDFKIYLGLLAESYNTAHEQDLQRSKACRFDMLVANLYPFGETIAKDGCQLEDARANIDIGGPAMLRASAKNFLRVAAVCDPRQYAEIIKELKKENGALGVKTRFQLAKAVFQHTAAYEEAICQYIQSQHADLLETIYSQEKACL